MSIASRRLSFALRSSPLVLGAALVGMALSEAGLLQPTVVFDWKPPPMTRHRTLAPPVTGAPLPATLVYVIDGDTFDARVRLDSGASSVVRVRLLGIDAPEMSARCAREWRGAQAARTKLREILGEGDLSLAPTGPDKYRRMLANAATRATPDVSAAMLSSGLVRAYDGGHRDGWCGRDR